MSEERKPWCSCHGFYCAVGGKECPRHNIEIGVGTYRPIKNKPGFYDCDVCGEGVQGFGDKTGDRHEYCMGTQGSNL